MFTLTLRKSRRELTKGECSNDSLTSSIIAFLGTVQILRNHVRGGHQMITLYYMGEEGSSNDYMITLGGVGYRKPFMLIDFLP